MSWRAGGNVAAGLNAHCAKEGKQPAVLERERGGNVLTGPTAAITASCIDPSRVVHTNTVFGADTYNDPDIRGAIIINVTPGSVPEKAGIKLRDVIYDYGGLAIGTASDLQRAVSGTSSGDRVLIKLHRQDKEVTATAQF